MLSREYFEVESQSDYKAHLICILSLKDHPADVQCLPYVFHPIFWRFVAGGKSCLSYSVIAGSTLRRVLVFNILYLQNVLYFQIQQIRLNIDYIYQHFVLGVFMKKVSKLEIIRETQK